MRKLLACLSITLACVNFTALAAPSAAQTPAVDEARSISSNPGAVDILVGSGKTQAFLENLFGIHKAHGIHFGGIIMADVNDLFSGGIPGAERWTNNEMLLLDFSVDTEKFIGWKG